MITKMFSVFDSKAACYGTPFFMQREQMAIRSFSDVVNEKGNPNNMYAKHPEDFSLVLVGEFDDDTCTFDSCKLTTLVTASALKIAVSGADVPEEPRDFGNVNGKVIAEVK